MSDANYNLTDAKVLTELEGLNGGVGGYLEHLAFDASPTSTTSATFVDVAGMPNQTFTTPVSGPHNFIFTADFYAATSGAGAGFQLLIDDSIIVSLGAFYHNATSNHDRSTFINNIDLTAGEHTIRPQWKRSSGSGTPTFDATYGWTLDIQAQGAGINGLEVIEDRLDIDFTVTAAYIDQPGSNMAQVSTVQCVVNTLEGERVQVSYNGSVSIPATYDVVFGYQVDSDTPVETGYHNGDTTAGTGFPCDFTTMTAPLSAGQHTIKLVAVSGVGDAVFLGAVANNYKDNAFQVTRFKSLGIGAGTIVTKDDLGSSSTTINSATVADTGLEVTINTIEGEEVMFNFSGVAQYISSSGGLDGFFFFLQVDGGTDDKVYLINDSGDSLFSIYNASFAQAINFVTAGSHTIKLRASCTASSSWSVRSNGTDTIARFQATQHRGGLIPIKDEGTEIVEKPSALNFVGALVEADGTEAKVTFPNAALGGYMEKLSFVATTTSTSTSFVDITGMPNQTFTTPVSGPHLIQFTVSTYAGTAYTVLEAGAVIDDGTVQSMGVSSVGDTSVYHNNTVSLLVDLAAGEHTIRPQWKRIDGTGTMLVHTSVPWTCTILAQGSGINGLEVEETVLASDHTITDTFVAAEGGGMTDVTGLSATVNTVEGERVQVTFEGSWFVPDATDNGIVYGYQVDSSTPIVVGYDLNRESTAVALVGFTLMTPALSAGSHTIKIKASRISGSTSPKILAKGGSYGFYVNSKMQVTRFTSQEREIVVAKYTNGAGTTITNNLLTILDFPTKEIDTHDAVTTGGSWVFTAPTAGYYRISSNVVMDVLAWGEAGFTWLVVYKNGAEHTSLDLNVKGTATATNTGAGGTTIIEMAAGDTLQVRIYINGGSDTDLTALANRNTVSINLIGGTLPAAESWTSFVPTGSWVSNATYTGFYRKIGDTLECRVQVACTGAPTAATLTINLPGGYTIDTSKLLSTTVSEGNFGEVRVLDVGVTAYAPGTCSYNDTTSVLPLGGIAGSPGLNIISNTIPLTFASGDKIWANFSVPVL